MSARRRSVHTFALLATTIAITVIAALPAAAAAGDTGFDISWPQCNGTQVGSVPSSQGSFDILGVNDGIVYSANPCLSAEYGWAHSGTAAVSFYANTADPGPTSSHWPVGQTANGHTCPAQKKYRIGTTAYNECSYLYGWFAAANSLADAEAATSTSTATAAQWWLDIESANSWTRNDTANIDDIQGGLDYLSQNTTNLGSGQGYVGIYTNSSSWSSITGSTMTFNRYPFWAPGATADTAAGTCTSTSASLTGGHIRYVQYQVNNFDNDYDCG